MPKTAAPRDILPVTLGTAGHIDHGKTTLLRALAGGEAETDRLAEERARGLTIDIGYAELKLDDGLEVGVVDVPGHEKFVRNMVAGATGIDVVMLVVAADDGVMPQTREHLDIMSLLGLSAGVVAITKADLVDEEMVELVASEVEDLVEGTFLEGAEIIPVSGISGLGLDALRSEIARLVREVPARDSDGFFRMPILRVFTSQGFGTIVTGIPVSGSIRVGDKIEVQPGERAGRVRGLQVYHRPSDHASAGHRTAINVADLGHRSVDRGDVVCEPGVFRSATLLDAKLRLLPGLSRPLRHNQEVRVHIGTVECSARPLLVGRKALEPGQTCWVQLKLDRAVVSAPGDPFIVRLPAQLITLGGGILLGPGAHVKGRRRAALAAQCEERERGLSEPVVAVESCLRRARRQGVTRAQIVAELMRRPEEIEPLLASLIGDGRAIELPKGVLLHADEAERLADGLEKGLRTFHQKNPLLVGMRKADLMAGTGGGEAAMDGVVQRMAAAGLVELLPKGGIRIADFRPQLSTAQRERADRIVEILAEDPWQTPRSGDLPRMIGALPDETDKLIALLEAEDRLVRLKDGVLLLTETIDEAKDRLRTHFETANALVPADLKRLFGLTRKYGIPLLEYLDTSGFTRRDGDRRVLR